MAELGGWEAVRQALRDRIGSAAFDAWFETLDAREEGTRLVLRCPDRFSRDWIRTRYGGQLEQAADGFSTIEYEISAEPEPAKDREAPATVESPRPKPRTAHHFDDFVVGPGNALALNCQWQVTPWKYSGRISLITQKTRASGSMTLIPFGIGTLSMSSIT